jgi:hypothetical protein
MKKITFLLTVSALFGLSTLTRAQVVTDRGGDSTLVNPSTWTVEPTAAYPLVIDENFQNWTLNHSHANTGTATKGRAAADAYQTWTQTINLVGPLAGTTAEISLIKCAVAPQGLSQNKIEYTKPAGDVYEGKNSNYTNGLIPDPEDDIPLSAGFLEVSRFTSNGTQYVKGTDGEGNEIKSTLADEGTYNGSITLPPIKGATIVQYSYSSLGGTKRGLKLERSIDGGATWEAIRNPLKNVVQLADKDPEIKVTHPSGNDDTPTEYQRYISAYFCSGAGVRVEDYIGDGEETVMLRFTICDEWKDETYRDLALDGTPDHVSGHNSHQDFRLHDLRLIAKAAGGSSGVTWKAPLGAADGDIINVAKGEPVVTGIDGLQVTHNFAQPVVNKSDADAPAATYHDVTYDNKSIVQAGGDNGQNFIFSPSKDGTLDVCGKMGNEKKNFIFETETPVATLVTYTTKNGGDITDKTAPIVTSVGLKADGTPMDAIPVQAWDASAAINTTGGNAWVVMSFPVTAGKNYVVGVDGSKFMLVGFHFSSGSTGIKPIDKLSKTLVIGLKGQLEIRSAENTVTVYNIAGQKVATIHPNSGSSIISVPQGVYIVAEKNQKAVKALVK